MNGNLKKVLWTVAASFICWLAYQQWEDIKFRSAGDRWTLSNHQQYEMQVLKEQVALRQYVDQKWADIGADELRRRLASIETSVVKVEAELIQIRLMLAKQQHQGTP